MVLETVSSIINLHESLSSFTNKCSLYLINSEKTNTGVNNNNQKSTIISIKNMHAHLFGDTLVTFLTTPQWFLQSSDIPTNPSLLHALHSKKKQPSLCQLIQLNIYNFATMNLQYMATLSLIITKNRC